jgi:hypothetical protein
LLGEERRGGRHDAPLPPEAAMTTWLEAGAFSGRWRWHHAGSLHRPWQFGGGEGSAMAFQRTRGETMHYAMAGREHGSRAASRDHLAGDPDSMPILFSRFDEIDWVLSAATQPPIK